MEISRGTVQCLLSAARCKVARALVGQKALAVSDNQVGDEDVAVLKEHNTEV